MFPSVWSSLLTVNIAAFVTLVSSSFWTLKYINYSITIPPVILFNYVWLHQFQSKNLLLFSVIQKKWLEGGWRVHIYDLPWFRFLLFNCTIVSEKLEESYKIIRNNLIITKINRWLLRLNLFTVNIWQVGSELRNFKTWLHCDWSQIT